MLVSQNKISYKKKSHTNTYIVCWPTTIVATFNLCLTFGGLYYSLRKEEEDLFCFFNVFQIQILETQSCCQNIAAERFGR